MKVVIACPAFTEHMGYLVNTLPRHLARHGADVHVIAGDLPFNYQIQDFASVYGSPRAAGALAPGVYENYDGYTLHIVPHQISSGHVRLPALRNKLRILRPDVVQTYQSAGWITLECAALCPIFGYVLFTGNHNAASTFPLWRYRDRPFAIPRLKSYLTRSLPGMFVSLFTEKCYAATVDCGEIAWRFLGTRRSKVEVMHLGVDTDFFYAPGDDERRLGAALRAEHGIRSDETVFVYTGKLTGEKNVRILAEAVAALRSEGHAARTLVVGEGPQRDTIAACDGAVVLPFVRHAQLPPYYWASDVGVWPTNESTSMLDAAACGLPLVVSDGIVYRDHVEGNGLVVRQHDRDDLINALRTLLDPTLRATFGEIGARKMREAFSMERVATQRLNNYRVALGKKRKPGSVSRVPRKSTT